jgi:hypothetical protein
MKRFLLLPFALALCGSAHAQLGSGAIPILNPGFETDVLTCAELPCYVPGITGWTFGPVSGTFKPGPAQYPNGVPRGVNVAGMGNANSTGSIEQTTWVPLEADRTYVLSMSIGQRADYPFTGYEASLVAGNVVLVSDSHLWPAPGTFVSDVIVFKSGPSPAQSGQPIRILVRSVGKGEVDVDNVSLTQQ